VGFLSTTEAEKGSIYIFGDPVYYLFTNRANAAAVHSHTPDFLTPALQQRLVDDLARNHPAYIFVADGQRSNVTSFKPYSRLLKDNYLVERESRWGVWYHRRIALN